MSYLGKPLLELPHDEMSADGFPLVSRKLIARIEKVVRTLSGKNGWSLRGRHEDGAWFLVRHDGLPFVNFFNQRVQSYELAFLEPDLASMDFDFITQRTGQPLPYEYDQIQRCDRVRKHLQPENGEIFYSDCSLMVNRFRVVHDGELKTTTFNVLDSIYGEGAA